MVIFFVYNNFKYTYLRSVQNTMKSNLAICTRFLKTDLGLQQTQLKHNVLKIWSLLGNIVKDGDWDGKKGVSHNILMTAQWPEEERGSLLCPYHVCVIKKITALKNCAIESHHTESFQRLQYIRHTCHLVKC